MQSRDVETGLDSDRPRFRFRDTRLFIRGIDKVRISDITTNIIRWQLMGYTQNQCALWGIPLRADRQSGYFCDRTRRCWDNRHSKMLVIAEQSILLAPKDIGSYACRYRPTRTIGNASFRSSRMNT